MLQEGGYFHGFYPKHGPTPSHPNIHQSNEPILPKHEIDFHQKCLVNSQQQQQQFAQFHAHDFEHHYTVKTDVVHKSLATASNLHGRSTDFSQNHMYYNENADHNPYYTNDFDVGNDAGYFDPKSQSHYYDMNYHHHPQQQQQHQQQPQHQQSGNDYADAYGTSAVISENCENFTTTFQQYYEQQHHQAHPHYPNVPQNAPIGYIQQQQNFPNSSQQIHPNSNLIENSNSSSDFNFLSNLNDFAPEYYQLS